MTADDAVAFFRDHLLAPASRRAAGNAAGVTLDEADVTRHVGVCLDACHMAVEFEDADAAISRLAAAGIRIAKVQLSSALRVRGAGGRRQALVPFAEDTYLHQVVAKGSGGLTRYVDLPQALQNGGGADDEWRVHFHVPIFAASMGEFETTQSYLADVIQTVARTSCTGCLEVETYTWHVLPPEMRTSDAYTAIARELSWVLSQLAA